MDGRKSSEFKVAKLRLWLMSRNAPMKGKQTGKVSATFS